MVSSRAQRSITCVALFLAVVAVACSDDNSPSQDAATSSTPSPTPGGEEPEATQDLAQTPEIWPADPFTTSNDAWGVEIVTQWGHDTDAFTQGLEIIDGAIFESTGIRGRSQLRELDEAREVRSIDLDAQLFGEGLTVVDEQIIQLTYQAGRALRWDLSSFTPVGEFTYDGEGWGLCYDESGGRLLMSDGTSTLTQRDPFSFVTTGEVTVRRDGAEVLLINELECVDGLVLANIWKSHDIVLIDPDSGEVLVTIDGTPLVQAAGVDLDDQSNVLNGLAHLDDNRFLIGGKNWPTNFVVVFTRG